MIDQLCYNYPCLGNIEAAFVAVWQSIQTCYNLILTPLVKVAVFPRQEPPTLRGAFLFGDKMGKITTRQQAFIDEYVMCLNSSEAARRAGYIGKSNVTGPRLLSYPEIRQAVDEGLLLRRKNGASLESPFFKKTSDKVYFIRAENGLVKIGITSNIAKRFEALNVASPVELVLLFYIETDEARKLEGSFHSIFESQWVKGEWFRLSDDDIAWIKNSYGIK